MPRDSTREQVNPNVTITKKDAETARPLGLSIKESVAKMLLKPPSGPGRNGPPCPFCNKTSRAYSDGRLAETCGSDPCVKLAKAERVAKAVAKYIPVRFAGATLNQFPETIREQVKERDSYLILGSPGVGKTHLAAALVRRDIEAGQTDIQWTRATRFILELNEAVQGHGQEMRVIAKYEAAQLLVLNDVGAEAGTDRAAAVIYDLIDARVEAMRPTILTTNLTLTDMAARDPRLASRVAGFRRVKLSGPDRRIVGGGDGR